MEESHPQEIEERLAVARTRQELEALLDEANRHLKENPDAVEMLHVRAGIHTKMQQFGPAINDYKRILVLDHTDPTAALRIEQLQTILKYSNIDIYANPNTNLDPWLD